MQREMKKTDNFQHLKKKKKKRKKEKTLDYKLD